MHQQDTQTDEKIHPYDLFQIEAFYKEAPAPLRSLAWDLLQTTPTPQNRPVLLAFELAMHLLENEEAREYRQEAGDEEPTPTCEEVIALFWRGHGGFAEESFSQSAPEAQREAISAAALALVALSPAKVSAGDASKSRGAFPEAIPAQKAEAREGSNLHSSELRQRATITRQRETSDTEEQLARV